MAEFRLLPAGHACAPREEADGAVCFAARPGRRARRPGLPGSSQDNADALPGAAPFRAARRGRWLCRPFDPAMVLVVGISAGVISTAAQLALWALAAMPLFQTLFRDARLTAAVILGAGVLPPPSTPRWDILLVATLIHFALSIAYAAVPACLVSRLDTRTAIAAGALYGLVIYAASMYGFTLLFPWFAVARDWVTLATHLVFGIALVWGCLVFAQRFRKRAG